jgi:hypothetical protein
MYRMHLQHMGTLLDEHGNHLAELLYAEEQELLQVQWSGNITGREVIYVAEEFLKLQKKLQVSLLLNDKSHATGDWADCMEWLEYDWLPQVISEGLRAVAYVFSPDIGNHYASIEFSDRVGQHLPIKLFYDVPSAWNWLDTQIPMNPNTSGRDFAAQA